ncbi:MAG: hypothetical protein RIE73_08805 [Coleofasciculus sp. C1-SOL-03]|uniref:hypothetical protein n=1 Tax=Coleofasciculus sp. C1-SOL-03 TaxID=3069522 RepID=UPI0032FDBAE7
MSYYIAFFWGIFILLSLSGWGGTVNRILFPKDQVDWGQKAAWGMAFSMVIGGLLNLTWTISKTSILLYLGLGFIGFILDIYQSKFIRLNSLTKAKIKSNNKIGVIIVACLIIGLLIIQYAGWVATDKFHSVDDYFAYLVFPNKMLDMGSMGLDPFSRRRLESSLGAQSFLHTFVLSILPERNIRIIDPGISWLILFLGVLGLFQDNNISPKKRLLILCPLLLVISPARNTTSIVVGSVLFLSLFRTLDWQKLKSYHFLNRASIIALITAAIFSSKYTLLIAAVILLATSYYFYIKTYRPIKKAFYELCAAGVLTLLFILPWMISLYQSSGTFLYPFLGKGYHAAIYYDHYTQRTSDMLTLKGFSEMIKAALEVTHIGFLLVAGAYLRLNPGTTWQKEERGATLSLLISSAVGIALLLGLAGVVAERYTFPFVYITIIVLVVKIISKIEVKDTDQNDPKFTQYTSALIAMLVLGMLIGKGSGWNASQEFYQSHVGNIRRSLSGKPLVLAPKQEAEQYKNAQESIPEGELLLTRLDKPFLLDFSRNKIYIVDSPGHASLPPGMPLFKGAEALSDYLTSQSIRYVAYSYNPEPAHQREYWLGKLGDEIYPWVEPDRIINVLRPSLRSEVQYTLDFQDNLKKLGDLREKIYDDGEIFVIDLSRRKKGLLQRTNDE